MTGVESRYDNVDLAVVRENTQGLYAGIEHHVIPGEAAEAIRIITRKASERIVRFAFDYAKRYGRNKVTAVHKSNILKITNGLFLSVAKEMAASYPDIEFEDRIVDNMAMQLVRNPNQFDVIVTTNLFGDILSDLCSGLVGGLGMAPGANIGEKLARLRAGSWLGPKVCRTEQGQPDGYHTDRSAYAASPGGDGSGAARRGCGAGRSCVWQGCHVRSQAR